jgi:AraC-like DNA-binding protein
MTQPRPLAVCGDYAPMLLYAASRWRSEVGSRVIYQRLKTYALLGVVEGVHTVRRGSRSWRMAPGSMAILTPDEPWEHHLALRGRLLYAVIAVMRTAQVGMGGNNTRRILPDEPRQPSPEAIWGVPLPVVQPPEVAEPSMTDLRAICDLWWRDDLNRMRANHLVGSVLLRAVAAASGPAGSSPSRSVDPLVDRALAALVGKPPPPTAAAWAAATGLHRNRFCDRFQAAMGVPPATYLRRHRLERAEAMLLSGQPSLDLIAIESGYRDVRALAHAFMTAHGCSPLVWRRTRQATT